ncbi:MAG: hypothetical protein QOE70_4692 [Chthoniobacter sp.]|nr:hypothetical protein [Chthoniobacter sp.]
MAAGAILFSHGDFVRSAASWKVAADLYAREHDTGRQADALHNLGQACQMLGQTRLAIEALESALTLATDDRRRAKIKAALGAAKAFSQQAEEAEPLLRESLALARQLGERPEQARIWNDLGNLQAGRGQSAEARRSYGKALDLGSQPSLRAKALANLAAAGETADQALSANRRAARATEDLVDSHEKIALWLTIGKTSRHWGREAGAAKEAAGAGAQARAVAERLKDEGGLSLALGFLGELYLAGGRLPEALALTQRAAFLAQKNHLPDALYQWEWQNGRILARQNEREPAIEAYRRALVSLDPIRHDVAIGVSNTNRRSSFREAVGPLFLELTDLLLQRADRAPAGEETQRLLREARDTLEQLKSAELVDYFQDDCVNLLRARTAPVESVAADAAVLYLVPLRDRTELLVGLRDGIHRHKIAVGAAELMRTVRTFRQHLETRTSYAYLTEATQLYDWLIRPLEPVLQQHDITTLVLVPDGALRTVPLQALHDGRDFLVARYAVSVTPGLTLMDAQPLAEKRPKLLLNGLSDAVQGYPPLGWVPYELENIRALYGGRVLADDQFSLAHVSEEFHDHQYSLVHIASHGQFQHDARNTYLLTYNERLTLNDLERLIRPGQFRGEPVELITLSACQTAAGDDRAALGLAGVAVKSGARSALATLWFVNDQSSSLLISEFYRELHERPAVSKAVALQRAQLKFLEDRRYQHPCYWAPYMLIGNWL